MTQLSWDPSKMGLACCQTQALRVWHGCYCCYCWYCYCYYYYYYYHYFILLLLLLFIIITIIVIIMIIQVKLGQTCLSDPSNVGLKIIYKRSINNL